MECSRLRVVFGLFLLFISALLFQGGSCGHDESHKDEEETTCSVLREVADSPENETCTTNGEEDCDTLDCDSTFSGMPINTRLTIEPCDEPPSVNIRLTVDSNVELEGDYSESGQALIRGGLATLHITLNQLDNAIGLELRITADNIIISVDDTFFQYTEIPIDCTSAPRPATTCLALQQIAASTNDDLLCKTNGNKDCDTMSCIAELQGVQVMSDFTVLPCNDIPAVRIVSKFGSKLLVDKVVSESEEFMLLTFKANVTLDQLDGAIGLQVDLIKTDGTVKEVLKYSEIPIDKTQCDEESSEEVNTGITLHAVTIQHLVLLSVLSSLLHLLQ